jgi:hypothetical protein
LIWWRAQHDARKLARTRSGPRLGGTMALRGQGEQPAAIAGGRSGRLGAGHGCARALAQRRGAPLHGRRPTELVPCAVVTSAGSLQSLLGLAGTRRGKRGSEGSGSSGGGASASGGGERVGGSCLNRAARAFGSSAQSAPCVTPMQEAPTRAVDRATRRPARRSGPGPTHAAGQHHVLLRAHTKAAPHR